MKNHLLSYLTLLAVLLSLFAVAGRAAANDDIFYAGSLNIRLNMESDFRLEGQPSSLVDFVIADLQFYPIDSPNQEVLSVKADPEAELHKDYYEYFWKEPGLGHYTYSLESEIRTHNRFKGIYERIPFPLEEPMPEMADYMNPSEKIDITDDIISQASSLAQGEDDLYSVVFNLASWTKKNINYSLNSMTADASQKASWVLKNRYGVCDELTNLFIAMCRSLGIPARFVSGVSYTNSDLFKEKWGLHGWAEVYFPGYGWVPFDPTYGQYGGLDATHIKLKDSIDSDKSSTKFEWQGDNIKLIPGTLVPIVTVNDQGNKIPEMVEMDVRPLGGDVQFGSYNLIEAKLKNYEDYYIGFQLILSRPEEVRIIDDQQKYVMLKPGEEKSVFWIIQTDKSKLDDKFLYTMPLEVSNSLGYSVNSSFKTSSDSLNYGYGQILDILTGFKEQDQKTYSRNLQISCNAENIIFVNETFNISCSVANKGNVFLKKVRICLQNADCQQQDIGIAQSKDVVFRETINVTGEQQLMVSARNNEVNTVQLVRVIPEDKPKITIEQLSYPEKIIYGPEFIVKFSLWKYSLSSPKNISISFRFNDKETRWDLDDIASNQGFEVKIGKNVLNPDSNKFNISVIYHDRRNNEYREELSQELSLQDPGFLGRLEMWINRLGREIENLLGKNQP